MGKSEPNTFLIILNYLTQFVIKSESGPKTNVTKCNLNLATFTYDAMNVIPLEYMAT